MPVSLLVNILMTAVLLRSVNGNVDLPVPFELSIADDPPVPCRHVADVPNIPTSSTNISLCFSRFYAAATKPSRWLWRAMVMSINLDNVTTQVDLKIRRVYIFSPGASFTLAGRESVSVMSVMKDLELGIHFNGHGTVSGASNDTVVFNGQLNTTVFEGHIIYQNLSRSHIVRCFHNNNLKPDFYKIDRCLVCSISTYNTTYNPVSPTGWRSDSNPLCKGNVNNTTDKSPVNASNNQANDNPSKDNQESGNEDDLGFPQSDYAGYAPASPGTHVSDYDIKTHDASTRANKTSRGSGDRNDTAAKHTSDINIPRQVRFPKRLKRSSNETLGSQHSPSQRPPRSGKATKQRTSRERRSSSQSRPRSSEDGFMETVSCSLHLVADHLFFTEMGERSPAKTVNLMLSVVIGADAVFRATDFNGDGVRDNIGFVVKNITLIHNSSAAFYGYSRTNGNSFQYLKSFSTGDFSDVCLGVAFTAIDFQRGVVGLAWYASSSSGGAGKGGICGQRVFLPNEGSSYSFNTAIVTFLNHGTSVSMEKAILTMAHEFGHCFGSSHDDMEGSACNGDYSRGSYLMQKYRPTQYFPNNYKFSPCSLSQMFPVIQLKGGCLMRYVGPTCGNGVVEEGEECDCGLSGACRFNDPCCSPGDTASSSPDPPCTVRRSQGMECSPVTSSCCSDSCRHITMAERYVCREATDCYSKASCDGLSPLCPVSPLHPDGTPCHGGIRACRQGRCRESMCVLSGLDDCFCRERGEDRCKLCCQQPGDSSRCLPASLFNITDHTGQVIYLPEGDGCLNYRGVCTVAASKGGGKLNSVGDRMRYCATVDSLDGDFSALIDLPNESQTVRRARLSSAWFYFLLIPLIPAIVVAAIFTGRKLCPGNPRGRTDPMTRADERRMDLTAVNTAHRSSQVFQQDPEGNAPAASRNKGFRRSHQQECQAAHQHQQSWEYSGRPTTLPFRRMAARSAMAASERSSPHRRQRGVFSYNSTLGRYGRSSNQARSPRQHVGAGYYLTRSLSSLSTSELSDLPPPRHEYRRCRINPYGCEYTNSYPNDIFSRKDWGHSNRLKASNRCSNKKECNRYSTQNESNHLSRHRLRASYSKPSIRTPLQRRRTLPTLAHHKHAPRRSLPIMPRGHSNTKLVLARLRPDKGHNVGFRAKTSSSNPDGQGEYQSYFQHHLSLSPEGQLTGTHSVTELTSSGESSSDLQSYPLV